MSLSMYQASIPQFVAMLKNLDAILEKAEVFAKERKIEESVLLNWRLAPDMFAFTRCPISIFTPPPPTASCAPVAWESANWTSSVRSKSRTSRRTCSGS
jgi:hypothetical protein